MQVWTLSKPSLHFLIWLWLKSINPNKICDQKIPVVVDNNDNCNNNNNNCYNTDDDNVGEDVDADNDDDNDDLLSSNANLGNKKSSS